MCIRDRVKVRQSEAVRAVNDDGVGVRNVDAGFDDGGGQPDALTVNGYLGTDGIKPLIDICNKEDKGIFVLVKTSNPSSDVYKRQ